MKGLVNGRVAEAVQLLASSTHPLLHLWMPFYQKDRLSLRDKAARQLNAQLKGSSRSKGWWAIQLGYLHKEPLQQLRWGQLVQAAQCTANMRVFGEYVSRALLVFLLYNSSATVVT